MAETSWFGPETNESTSHETDFGENFPSHIQYKIYQVHAKVFFSTYPSALSPLPQELKNHGSSKTLCGC